MYAMFSAVPLAYWLSCLVFHTFVNYISGSIQRKTKFLCFCIQILYINHQIHLGP